MKPALSILLLLITFNCGNLYAKLSGQARVDSMLLQLPKAKDDTDKVKLLNDLTTAYQGIDPDKGIGYGEEALQLATKLNWGKGMANAQNRIGSNYLAKANYPKALECYEACLAKSEEVDFKRGIAVANGNIGNIYQNQGDYPKALEYYLKALKMDEEIGDKQLIAMITGNIGNVYNRQSNYPKALEQYFNALKVQEELKDYNGIARNYNNISTIYRFQKNYTKALEYLFNALKLSEQTGDLNQQGDVFMNISNVYYNMKNYKQTVDYALKCMEVAKKLGDKNKLPKVYAQIGIACVSQRIYNQGINYLLTALKLARETDDKYTEGISLEVLGEGYVEIVTHPAEKNEQSAITAEHGPEMQTAFIPADRNAILRQGVQYLDQAIVIDKSIGNLDQLQSCYRYLSIADSLLGNFEGAFEAYKQYVFFKDSVFGQQKVVEISRLEMVKKIEVDSLKSAQEKHVVELKLKQQRSYTWLGISAVLLLSGFSFFIVKERSKSEKLLLNILPAEVAAELKSKGVTTAKHFDNVTVLFTDFVNFTQISERMSPQELIDELNTCFIAFDKICVKHGIEKIKTIGDAYLAICGLPHATTAHAENTMQAAIEINAFMRSRLAERGSNTFQVRIGMHSGNVVAGIVGLKKFAYDIWGDTVNTAARMEQNSTAGRINISGATYELVKNKFNCEYRGEIEAKNKGVMKMYFVDEA